MSYNFLTSCKTQRISPLPCACISTKTQPNTTRTVVFVDQIEANGGSFTLACLQWPSIVFCMLSFFVNEFFHVIHSVVGVAIFFFYRLQYAFQQFLIILSFYENLNCSVCHHAQQFFSPKQKLKNEMKCDSTSHQYLKSRLVFEETF